MLNQNILTNMLVSNSITKVDIVKGPQLETYFIPGGAESIATVIAKSDMRSVMRFTADYENGFIAVASGGRNRQPRRRRQRRGLSAQKGSHRRRHPRMAA